MLRQDTWAVFISNFFRRKSMSDGWTQHSSWWKTGDNSMVFLCPTIRRVGQIQIPCHRGVRCLLSHCLSVLEWSSYSSGSVCGSQQGEMIGKTATFWCWCIPPDCLSCLMHFYSLNWSPDRGTPPSEWWNTFSLSFAEVLIMMHMHRLQAHRRKSLKI